MVDYNVEKEKEFLDDIHQLTSKIKSDIKDSNLSETEIQNKIILYEKNMSSTKLFFWIL